MSENQAMKELDHKRRMAELNAEKQNLILQLEIEKIKKRNKDGEEVNQDEISN